MIVLTTSNLMVESKSIANTARNEVNVTTHYFNEGKVFAFAQVLSMLTGIDHQYWLDEVERYDEKTDTFTFSKAMYQKLTENE